MAKAPLDLLHGQVVIVQDLLAEEKNSKWATLALLQLRVSLGASQEDQLEVVQKLESIDFMHAGFYRHLRLKLKKGLSIKSALFV